ncbi:DUF3570 domain-containing protein [Sandaracinus amylolyticus]|uniref:DUF3570 domain-containing protein n=1 Tax=Sandaracinus amylolyticus TaxID=927083 RepID=UPI001F3D075C|nr:DUF3570 domain-containing protein [Sandaracinus amylolyticus]UJR85289.1 Hypothetical protein I5071_73690 [Sandaracinus amylolyticus]
MTSHHASRHFVRILVALAVALLVSPARADETTGTWTGEVGVQGNYYWETSTRVVAPEVRFRLTSPDGTDVRAEYLVDSITSASLAAGVVEDIRFTETRHQVTVGTGHEFDLGEAQLRLDASTRISHEPDYLATGVTLAGTLSLAQRCTLIGMALTYIHDDVGSVVRGTQPREGGGRDLSNRGRVGQLEGFTLGLSLSQILTPQLVASFGYDLVYNWGYLQNPYRGVSIEGVVRPEEHPDERLRHSLYGRVALYVPETRTAFHALYRFYVDGWDLAAVTPEARVYQEIGDLITLRLRYRFYSQTRSFFYRAPDQYTADDPFVTNDPKMQDFSSHLVGAHARVAMEFLERTFLGFAHEGEVWFSVDYWWQSSRFGNGVIAQAGLRVPF